MGPEMKRELSATEPGEPWTVAVATRDRRRWAALVVLCVGQLMIVLDVTVVNVALPTIQRELHFSQASLAWVVNGYLITFGGLLLLAGRIGDLVGRKKVFIAGLMIFTAASLLCGLANSQGLLIGGRFVQGVGAAIDASMILGILVTSFPEPAERARALGVYAFVAAAGSAIGLLVGGVLTQALSWHWIFFINLPIGVAAALGGMFLVNPHEGLGFRQGVDVPGSALIVAAPTLAVYTIVKASDFGWTSGRTLGLGAGVVILLIAFVLVEARVRNPLVPLRVFRSRNLTGADLVRALFAVGMLGMFFMGALYLQSVLGYGAIRTGFAFLPWSLLVGLFSLGMTVRIVARIGAKATLIIGLVLFTLGLGLFARAPVGGTYLADVLPGMVMLGLGAGLVFMPSVSLAMSDAAPSESGLASGLANVSLQIGGALGLAAVASLSTTRTANLLAGGASAHAALNGGYHLGFVVAAGAVLAAIGVASAVLRGGPAAP